MLFTEKSPKHQFISCLVIGVGPALSSTECVGGWGAAEMDAHNARGRAGCTLCQGPNPRPCIAKHIRYDLNLLTSFLDFSGLIPTWVSLQSQAGVGGIKGWNTFIHWAQQPWQEIVHQPHSHMAHHIIRHIRHQARAGILSLAEGDEIENPMASNGSNHLGSP